jgi:hypothetical protein
MLYIIAILLLILVLAIPAARNILSVLLASALGLGLVGLVLAGLALLGWWLWSIDWKPLQPVMNLATAALSIIWDITAPFLGPVFLFVVLIGGPLAIVYDQYRLRKK